MQDMTGLRDSLGELSVASENRLNKQTAILTGPESDVVQIQQDSVPSTQDLHRLVDSAAQSRIDPAQATDDAVRPKSQDRDVLQWGRHHAKAYLERGETQKAVKTLQQALQDSTVTERDPAYLESRGDLAEAYFANGKLTMAVMTWKGIIQVGEKLGQGHQYQIKAHYGLARVHLARAQHDEAVALLERIVQLRPNDLFFQQELAHAYLASSQPSKAAPVLERVCKADPTQVLPQHSLTKAYLASGQRDKAALLLDHILRLGDKTPTHDDNNLLEAQRMLANAYLSYEQKAEAVQLLEHVVKVGRSTLAKNSPYRLRAQSDLGEAYLAHGRSEEAVSMLEDVVDVLREYHPNDVTTWHSLADAYLALDQVEEAVKLLDYVASQ